MQAQHYFPGWHNNFMVLVALFSKCRSPTEGPALLHNSSLKIGKTAGEQRKKRQDFSNSRYCLREQFLKASSQKRKWT